jgi:acetate kinase
VRALVLNCGSSSVKFQVVERAQGGAIRRVARGAVEKLGPDARLVLSLGGDAPQRERLPVTEHEDAVARILAWVRDDLGAGLDVVGHRVVHGGTRFVDSVRIDDAVVRGIEAVAELAPLHVRPSLAGIRAARTLLGHALPMVAVFDTAFHARLPERAWRYAIPREVAERHGIRRFGFHGTSYRYVLGRFASITGVSEGEARLVVLHLGSGCSAVAIAGGASIDTSMGFTPLEGLVMGTRSGDLDPYIVAYLAHRERLTVDEVEALLNTRSGLLGLSGSTGDMRELTARAAAGDAAAASALDIFAYRARKYVGAYLAALGGADAVVFTGGVGEHVPTVRAAVCDGLAALGLVLDPAANAAAIGVEARITSAGAGLAAYVIPTDEELMIAMDCFSLWRSL